MITRNKARIMAQGYNQEEITDCEESYALVARLEAIRLLLAYSHKAWYERLSKFLINQGYSRGKVYTTFSLNIKKNILL